MTAARITWTDESVFSEGDTNSLNVSTNILEFDIVQRLAQNSKAEVTQFTIEEGAPLTDHKRKQPQKVVIDGLVTNTPITEPPPAGRGTQYGVSGIVRGTGVGNVLEFSREFDRVQDVFDTLNKLVSEPIFVTLETPQRTYERMTVVGIDDIRENSTPDGVTFKVSFQEIFVGEISIVDIPVPVEPRGQQEREETASSPESVEEEETGPPKSWAVQGGEFLGFF